MPVEVKIPEIGESITEAIIAAWLKKPGDSVDKDEPVVELETDKVSVEVPAPSAGVIGELLKKAGETANVGDVIAYINESTDASANGNAGAKSDRRTTSKPQPDSTSTIEGGKAGTKKQEKEKAGSEHVKEPEAKKEPKRTADDAAAATKAEPARKESSEGRQEELVPLSPMRKRIAQRLVSAQQTAAMLTTFNEIDMSAVQALRKKYREAFEARYGIRLGLMSFFVKAVIEGLKAEPRLNAEIREDHIAYRNFYDIGMAVSTEKGLLVPVLRNAERLSFAQIESAIADFAQRARTNQIDLDELRGGTFTITNGGVFGSLLSTPILNPPQSGILGLHTIQDRPVAIDGQVVIRPMMYVALTYDHRLVDGREAVTFLKRIKDLLEDPARLLVEV